jgi:hypothetical protein
MTTNSRFWHRRTDEVTGLGTGGAGLWRAAGVPHRGWCCIDMEDLGDEREVCEMCQIMEIRYVHVMEHKDYPQGPLRCGCVCAGHMEMDRAGARKREGALKGRMRRRETWMAKPWRTSAKGNAFKRVRGCVAIVGARSSGTYFAMLIDSRDKKQFIENPAGTAAGAKAALFDALNP